MGKIRKMSSTKTTIETIDGWRRFFFVIYLFVFIFMRYTKFLFLSRISFKKYLVFFKRLLLFYKRLIHNKYIRVNGLYKMQLYLPAFPARSFFHAIEKFLRDGEPMPITVVFSITKACTYRCPHCYQKYDTGADLTLGQLIKMAKVMQNIGVAMMDIEGGEPLIRFDRLLELIRNIDDRTEVWINTNGYGLTDEKARLMKEADVFGVMISLHHWDREKFDGFCRVEGAYDTAIKAMKIFNQVGITTAVNCCATEELITSGGLDKIMDIAKEHGCSFVQVIHGKSAGGWIEKDGTVEKDFVQKLCDYHLLYNTNPRYRDYPSISIQVYEESMEVFGCTAGGIDRFYVNAHGEVQPCEFVNVSFGNVQDKGFLPVFMEMRRYFKRPGINWLCCSECKSILEIARKMGKKALPLKREITEDLVKTWDKGEETPLYKSLGLYKT